jgi:hypothetical protein
LDPDGLLVHFLFSRESCIQDKGKKKFTILRLLHQGFKDTEWKRYELSVDSWQFNHVLYISTWEWDTNYTFLLLRPGWRVKILSLLSNVFYWLSLLPYLETWLSLRMFGNQSVNTFNYINLINLMSQKRLLISFIIMKIDFITH